MAANNSCNFMGNLTRDPESRNAGGKTVAQFSLAIDGWKKDESHFFDFEAWEKTASFITENLAKGDRVAVECEAKQDRWDDKTTGDKRSKVLFTVRDLKVVRVKKWDDKRAEDAEGDSEGDEAPAPAPSRRQASSSRSKPAPSPFEDDEDINF